MLAGAASVSLACPFQGDARKTRARSTPVSLACRCQGNARKTQARSAPTAVVTSGKPKKKKKQQILIEHQDGTSHDKRSRVSTGTDGSAGPNRMVPDSCLRCRLESIIVVTEKKMRSTKFQISCISLLSSNI
ncbi:hypothetical protein NDU88_007236 [Pleurodeles waltl]|uniref:Uncharacterized protein n=1 Tax=Pleurodeles waltl TaxID=8319 RepID=A0AAV7UNT0_PLEWA|nr:hypothetical protein NDU88_007236 [Pleurodeles waltl]